MFSVHLTLSTNIILILPPVEQVGPVVAVGQLIVEVGEAELVDIVWAVLLMRTCNPVSRVTSHLIVPHGVDAAHAVARLHKVRPHDIAFTVWAALSGTD